MYITLEELSIFTNLGDPAISEYIRRVGMVFYEKGK
jgi:hypothetical protein